MSSVPHIDGFGQTIYVSMSGSGTAGDPYVMQPAKDDGPAWTSVFGVSGAAFASADASGADAAVTDAPTAGQKLVIRDVFVSTDTAMRIDLKEETSGTVIFSGYFPANSGIVQLTPRSKVKLATADKKLMVRTSASGNVRVTTTYSSEA